ncbi:hypothetical protein [Rhodococcus sp. NCIMB 12038]|nr:hypothetical protein [Rhodococcus sp. NCIMB 12038]
MELTSLIASVKGPFALAVRHAEGLGPSPGAGARSRVLALA